MAVQVSYPGVYIEEFAPGAPIQGVGTSTAGFLGVIKYGRPNVATRITSWDGFLRTFWRLPQPPDPMEPPEDTDYLWYAVRGFFDNGGKNCFVVNVSNAVADSLVLRDTATTPAANPHADPQPTVRIWAREAKANSGLSVKAEPQSAVQAGAFFRPSATVSSGSSNTIEVTDADDAIQFLSGDAIQVKQSTKVDSVVVDRIDGKLIRLTSPLKNAYTGGTVRLDALADGATTFRAEDVAKLAAGSAIRISQTGKPSLDARVTSVSSTRISPTLTTYRVTVDQDVSGFDMLASSTNRIGIVSQEFKLTIQVGNVVKSTYEELAMDPGHPRYFASIINNDSERLIAAAAVEPPNTTSIPNNRPSQAAFVPLAGGADHDPATITANDFVTALRLFQRIDDLNLVAAPGRDEEEVQRALVAHAENMQDRFALLEMPRGTPMSGGGGADTLRGIGDSAHGYAAIYYPWLMVTSVKSGKRMPVPPTGHVAGIYARTDTNRGVHKAPAGNEAMVSGVLGVETTMSDDEQGGLNKIGVNVIRVFQAGGRPVVWGARTTATTIDSNWQYVNIRRLFLFLEESIQEGIRWAVLEPNIPSLHQKLKRSITAFLTQQWRDGALYGTKADEAFYVRIDEILNPPDARALGRLTIEVGVAPAYPAEFIVVRIGIWQGGSDVNE
jgi:uncharacterized protein